MSTIHLTAIMPTFGRPQRTKRMLQCVADQIKNNFELLIIGDACEDLRQLMKTEWWRTWRQTLTQKGNYLNVVNLSTNHGGHGAGAVNYGITVAKGQYCCFLNNDDIILPEHFQFYYSSISRFEGKPEPPDFVYNRTYINSGYGAQVREPELRFGCVGHAELVVNTAFLRKMPPHEPVYGQDWKLIENMMKAGHGVKGDLLYPTYMIMSTPNYKEPGID